MKLYELFNNIGQWKWIDETKDSIGATFNINGVDYEFSAWEERQVGVWYVEFINNSTSAEQRFGITGQGSSSSVLATVNAILKELIKKKEIYSIGFVAVEPNRMQLYKRIAKTVFPDWSTEQNGTVLQVTHRDYVNEDRMKNPTINTYFENRVEQARYNKEYDDQYSSTPVQFAVMINGKIWKRKGEPVLFPDHATALRAADKITADRNITTQVVPHKR